MTPEQQVQALTEIVGDLKDQVAELRRHPHRQELARLRRTVEAQQQQIVQLSEFVSLVTEAIPGHLFPSYQLTPGGQTDGIDLQRTRSGERTRRWAEKAVRQIKTRWSTPYPPRGAQPTDAPVRGGGLLPDR